MKAASAKLYLLATGKLLQVRGRSIKSHGISFAPTCRNPILASSISILSHACLHTHSSTGDAGEDGPCEGRRDVGIGGGGRSPGDIPGRIALPPGGGFFPVPPNILAAFATTPRKQINRIPQFP